MTDISLTQTPDLIIRTLTARRAGAGDIRFRLTTMAAAILVLLIFTGVVASLILGAMPAIKAFGFGFITTEAWSPARDRFGAVVSVGCGALIFWHAFINVGMVSGMLPVVGMPLPLFSYGGSSVLTITLSLALLMNVSMRKYAGFSALSRF